MNPRRPLRLLAAAASLALISSESCPGQFAPTPAISLPAAARINSIGADQLKLAFIVGSTRNQTIYIRDRIARTTTALSAGSLLQDHGRSVDLLEPDPQRSQLGSFRLAVVGCPGYQQGLPPNGGRVIVYGLQGSTLVRSWSIVTPQPRTNGQFGYSVSISTRNNAPLLAIGEPGGGVSARGRVYLYTYDNVADTWVGEQTLSTGGPSFPGDRFGATLDLRDTKIVVGAPMHDVAGPDSGAADLYEFIGGSWVHRQFIAGFSTGARTGTSVSIDEEYAAIGSPLWGQRNGRFDVYDHRLVASAVYSGIGDDLGELGTSIHLHRRRRTTPHVVVGKPLARLSGAAELHRIRDEGSGLRPAGKIADWQIPSQRTLARFGTLVIGDRSRVVVLATGAVQDRLQEFPMTPRLEPHLITPSQTPGFQGLAPDLVVLGEPLAAHRLDIDVSDCNPNSPAALFVGPPYRTAIQTPLGALGIQDPIVIPAATSALGEWSLRITPLPELFIDALAFQFLVFDPAAGPGSLAISDTVWKLRPERP